AADLRPVLLSLIERASFGWEQVVLGIVRLCTALLDYATTSGARRRYGDAAMDRVVELGIRTLYHAFYQHEFIRSRIIGHITSQIPFRSASTDSYLRLATLLFDKCFDRCLAYSDKLRDILDYIIFLPPAVSRTLILSLGPIIRHDPSYCNNLLLALRKGMFTKSEDERQVALAGLFSLIHVFSAEVQISTATPPSSAPTGRDTLGSILEILNMVRHCLSKQVEIRVQVYASIRDLLESGLVRNNRVLRTSLHNMLRIEVAKYYKHRGTGPDCSNTSFNLHACLHQSTNKVLVPVPHMLQCFAMTTIAIAAEDSRYLECGGRGGGSSSSSSSSSNANSLDNAIYVWMQIIEWLVSSDLEDFELDSACNFDQGDPTGVRNQSMSQQLLGCYDVAMEFIMLFSVSDSLAERYHGFAATAADRLCTLSSRRHKLFELLRSRTTNELGRKVSVNPFASSLMTQRTLSIALPRILGDATVRSSTNRATGLSAAWRTWGANAEIVRYLLGLSRHRIYELCEQSNPIDSSDPAPVTEALATIVTSVYSYILMPLSQNSDSTDVGGSHGPRIAPTLTAKTPKA
ncbi:hypothetical protein EV182_001751, partial [Spiromyces aspiralis]